MILGPCLSQGSLNYLHWSPEVAVFRDVQSLEVLALETRRDTALVLDSTPD